MAIRHLAYLACDECLDMCADSDGDCAADCRRHGRRLGWKRIAGRDICPKCLPAVSTEEPA